MDAIYQFDTRTSRQNVRVLVSLDMSDPATAKDEKGKPQGFEGPTSAAPGRFVRNPFWKIIRKS